MWQETFLCRGTTSVCRPCPSWRAQPSPTKTAPKPKSVPSPRRRRVFVGMLRDSVSNVSTGEYLGTPPPRGQSKATLGDRTRGWPRQPVPGNAEIPPLNCQERVGACFFKLWKFATQCTLWMPTRLLAEALARGVWTLTPSYRPTRERHQARPLPLPPTDCRERDVQNISSFRSAMRTETYQSQQTPLVGGCSQRRTEGDTIPLPAARAANGTEPNRMNYFGSQSEGNGFRRLSRPLSKGSRAQLFRPHRATAPAAGDWGALGNGSLGRPCCHKQTVSAQ